MKTLITSAALALGVATAATAVPVVDGDFGSISGGAETMMGAIGGPYGLAWYSFEVEAGATHLDIYTSITEFDTEVGLFAADGMLIAERDDIRCCTGEGLNSALTFGTGSGVVLDDGASGFTLDGRDGAMPGAGTYYVSVSAWVTFFDDDFGVDPQDDIAEGGFNLTIKSEVGVAPVPLPAALPLLGLALAGLGVAGLRRRS